MDFPDYDYADMIEAQRRMLVEGLKVDRLRLMMGTSMGCMHGFVWGEKNPDFVQAMMPMACLPVQIAGHNRMWRKAATEGIKADPAWAGGNYRSEEHTSELQSLMRISYDVFCLKKTTILAS